MSILYTNSGCTLISHKSYIDRIYNEVVEAACNATLANARKSFVVKAGLFDVSCGNVKSNRNENESPRRRRKVNAKKRQIEIGSHPGMNLTQQLSKKSAEFLDDCRRHNLFQQSVAISPINGNDSFLKFKEICCRNVLHAPLSGRNSTDNPVITSLSGETYLIPPNSKFSNSYVSQIIDFATELYDFVVLDPPWWNKYIRRVRNSKLEEGYDMMYNEDILKIPIEDFIHSKSLVAIWCTNSPTHLEFVKKIALPKWNLKLLSTFYWVKINNSGDPICEFNLPLRKQPYEHLFIATHIESDNLLLANIDDSMRLICSVPSIIHSHKPPLLEIFAKYLPSNPKCLEIFARYLLPNFSSIGREVLKLQNVTLFDEINCDT